MYRDGVGHIQLRQHIGGVGGGAVVKADDDQLPGGVDVLYHAHVTVENAAAGGAVVLLPDHVVVVAGLHDPVAHPERYIAPLLLPPSGSRRVQRRLQSPVQRRGAAGALPGGREHLYLLGGDAHVPGQALPAQLHHRLHQPVR